MKIVQKVVIVFSAVFLLPQWEEEEDPIDKLVRMKQQYIGYETKIAQLGAMKKMVDGALPKVTQFLIQSPVQILATPEEIQKLRQEVTSLQEEYEKRREEAEGFLIVEDVPVNEEREEKTEEKVSVVRAHPLIEPDLARLGSAFYSMGKYKEAYEMYTGDSAPWSQIMAAKCLTKLERINDAIAALQKILDSNPDPATAENAGRILEFLKSRSKLGSKSEIELLLAEIIEKQMKDDIGSTKTEPEKEGDR